MTIIQDTKRKLRLAFTEYPRKGHSPADAAIEFRSKQFIDVRGNEYGRLNRGLEENEREKYLRASAFGSDAYKKNEGDISCILNELKKL